MMDVKACVGKGFISSIVRKSLLSVNSFSFLIICSLVLSVSFPGETKASSENLSGISFVFYQVPAETDLPASFLPPNPFPPDGSRIVRLDPGQSEIVNLTPEFVGAAYPEVSFCGERILFAGKKESQDTWQIWEMRIDGSGKRKITEVNGNCAQPRYLGGMFYLDDPGPTDQIVFVSDMAGHVNEFGEGKATALYTSLLDGGAIRRITRNVSSDFSPYVVPDGRVIYSSWQTNGNRFPPNGLIPLLAVLTDGVDMLPFYGSHHPPFLRHQAANGPDGFMYFIESEGSAPCGGGHLAAVTMRRPLHSYRVIQSDPRFLFQHPCPLAEHVLLISRLAPATEKTYGLYLLNNRKGISEQETFTRVYADPDRHSLGAAGIRPRPRPDGRASVVRETREYGRLYCLDVYNTDRPEGRFIRRGDIRRLRVIEPLFLTDEEFGPPLPEGLGLNLPGSSQYSASGMGPRRLLGVVPVEEDGSFFIEIPGGSTFYFQTVDENGMALQTMKAYTWSMPSENRGCIGCHEDREIFPDNLFVQAVKRPQRRLMLPPERRRTVEFARDVMPILERSCLGAECHNVGAQEPFLENSPASETSVQPFNHAYLSLLEADPATPPDRGRWITPGYARDSRLIWTLFGKNTTLGAPEGAFSLVKRMPPDKPLGDFDRQTLIEWVDLGAQWTNQRIRP